MEDAIKDRYEVVIGLEVHAQLLTKTKAYSSDLNEYGSAPNTNVSAITLGHPGTLPVMNKTTIDFAEEIQKMMQLRSDKMIELDKTLPRK